MRYSESRNSILAIVLQLVNASFWKKNVDQTSFYSNIPVPTYSSTSKRNRKITTLPRLLYLIVNMIMFLWSRCTEIGIVFFNVSILNFEKKKRKRKKSKKNYRKLSRLRKVVREKFRLEKIKEFLRGSKDVEKEIAVGVTYQSTTHYLFDDWIATTTTYRKKWLFFNPHGADISNCHSVSNGAHLFILHLLSGKHCSLSSLRKTYLLKDFSISIFRKNFHKNRYQLF